MFLLYKMIARDIHGCSGRVGFCGIFWHFPTPKQNPALEVLSTPAHTQVTQTVRRFFIKQ
ncbi:MAG: hypothetical protein HZC38_16285 [Chloroflexi bacterium]|nr:hypothetical protein [Chloroflexota bacterium]